MRTHGYHGETSNNNSVGEAVDFEWQLELILYDFVLVLTGTVGTTGIAYYD